MKVLRVMVALAMVFGCLIMPDLSYAVTGKAPDFSLMNVNGGRVSLSETLKSKPALLVFWATWCPYCVKETPAVEAFYQKNKDKVAVVGINLQEHKDKVAKFASKHNLNYPIVSDADGTTATSYGVQGIPTVVAVGQDGNILYFGHDLDEAAQKLGV